MPRWLLALTAGALVFYTDDYVIAGVLPEIARSLRVSVGTAGQLVTVFSVTVAVAAPFAAVASASLPRRTVLVGAALVFTAANAGAALSPAFPVFMALRVAAALAAATATPALFATAVLLAAPERTGRAVAAVAFGVTGAIAFGVPAGAWIGGAFGWRATFAITAAGGALVAAGFAAFLPGGSGGADTLPVRAQLAVLRRPAVSLGLVANVVLMFGSMTLLTSLAPFTAEPANADVTDRGFFFAASGLAGMAGIWAGGRATDAWGPRPHPHHGRRSVPHDDGRPDRAVAAAADPVPPAPRHPDDLGWCRVLELACRPDPAAPARRAGGGARPRPLRHREPLRESGHCHEVIDEMLARDRARPTHVVFVAGEAHRAP